MQWTDKSDGKAQGATHKQRMVAGFLHFAVDLWTNDDMEGWEMAGISLWILMNKFIPWIYFINLLHKFGA